MTQPAPISPTPKPSDTTKEYLLVTAPLQSDDIEEALETKVSNLLILGWVCSGGPIALNERIYGKIDESSSDLQIDVLLAQAMIREAIVK